MLIFDLDGTLWDSSVSVADSWNILIRKETGIDRGLKPEDIKRNMGKTMNAMRSPANARSLKTAILQSTGAFSLTVSERRSPSSFV